MNMISVEEALAYILKHFHPLEAEPVSMLDALGLVLAEDIVAEINVPPFNNSAMDGYAVRAKDIAGASSDHPTALRMIGDVAAGHTSQLQVGPGTAIRIMTGAPLPQGADTVVRFEDTLEGVQARTAGQNRVKCGNSQADQARRQCASRGRRYSSGRSGFAERNGRAAGGNRRAGIAGQE